MLCLKGWGSTSTATGTPGSLMDYWRWGFSDLADDAMRSTVADLLAKVWLGVGPGYMTADELRILRTSSPVAEELQTVSGMGYDA